MITKLKTTQDKSLEQHTALRNWCAATQNKTLNDLDTVECLLDLLADRVKVNNAMSLSLNELGTLKNDANIAPKQFIGEKLNEQLQVLKPRFTAITDKLKAHYKDIQDLQKKYEEKISEISKRMDKNSQGSLDKKFEAYATHSQLSKETVLKGIIETQNSIKSFYENQKMALKTQWETLYNDRYWNTCRDFETIYDTANSSWNIKWAVKTFGFVKGEFAQDVLEHTSYITHTNQHLKLFSINLYLSNYTGQSHITSYLRALVPTSAYRKP